MLLLDGPVPLRGLLCGTVSVMPLGNRNRSDDTVAKRERRGMAAHDAADTRSMDEILASIQSIFEETADELATSAAGTAGGSVALPSAVVVQSGARATVLRKRDLETCRDDALEELLTPSRAIVEEPPVVTLPISASSEMPASLDCKGEAPVAPAVATLPPPEEQQAANDVLGALAAGLAHAQINDSFGKAKIATVGSTPLSPAAAAALAVAKITAANLSKPVSGPVEILASASGAALAIAPAIDPPQPLSAEPSTSPALETTVTGAASSAMAFEDSVTEVLRPMLREWLDANLPRLVDKALKAELGQDAGDARVSREHRAE